MTAQQSYCRIEKELLPAFRQQMSTAESTEEVKKFFIHTVMELLRRVSDGAIGAAYEDIRLERTGETCRFELSRNLSEDPSFIAVWDDSDLPRIVGRFAVSACNRHRHLEKNPEKTESKIRLEK